MDATAADAATTVEASATIHVCGSSLFSAAVAAVTTVSSAAVDAMTAAEETVAADAVTIHASGSSSFFSAVADVAAAADADADCRCYGISVTA